jgi:glycosyltransferase involved in cell wall biosynthesis
MRVLFLSRDFVLPATYGLRVRALSQLRVLASMPEIERVTLLSLGEPIEAAHLAELEAMLPRVTAVAPVRALGRVRKDARAFGAFLKLRLVDGLPYLAAVCESAAMRALVMEQLSRGRSRGQTSSSVSDVVYLGHLGMARYLPLVRRLAPSARVVLEEHNVEWRIFDRLAERMRPPLRQAMRVEARSLRRFERRVLREVDSVIAISEDDAQSLHSLAGVRAHVVPPFVEPGRLRADATNGPHLGYIGHLAWQPNVHGLDWFCESVWPRVRELVPEATLSIAGPGLPKAANGSLAVPPRWSRPGITALGFVDDLEDVYRNVLGMVAPVIGGSGVRMKLLETMRAGIPTITTSDGAAGLGVTDGREVVIADDPRQFAEGVVRVLTDASLRETLRRSGHEFLASRHSAAVAEAGLRAAIGPGLPP